MALSFIQDVVDNSTSVRKLVPFIASEDRLSTFRSIVPLLADGSINYLNASYQPPLNLVVYGAINKHTFKALYNPHPKPKPGWQGIVEEARELVARYKYRLLLHCIHLRYD